MEALERFLTGMRRGCAKDAIDYALIRTSEPLDAALAAFLVGEWQPNEFTNDPSPVYVLSVSIAAHHRPAADRLAVVDPPDQPPAASTRAWAAMDFLLESQKRNKKWIFLRQLLLMLMRTAAFALVVFMLAGPVLQFQWGRFFGKGTTHHLVLLDDSYSMSDRKNQTTAFDEAKRVVQQLLDQATQQAGDQRLTLLRCFSSR